MTEGADRRWSDAKNQFRDAWLIVLTLGGIVIIAGNWLNMGPWPVAGIVSMCMAIYGLVIQSDGSYADVPADTKGDSIYYLGLIFTFGALVAALVTFDWDTSNAGNGASGAIRNFGIALLTTIVGLAGRVWFTIFRESPGDLVDSTRSDLEHVVSGMKTSLDRARSDLDIMAGQFRESTTEMTYVAATAASYSKAVSDATGVIARVAGAFSDRVVEMTEILESRISGVSKSFAAVSDSVSALVRDAAGLEQRIGAVGSSVDKTARGLDELGKSARDVARSVAATDGVAVRMTREMSSMERNIADAGKRAGVAKRDGG